MDRTGDHVRGRTLRQEMTRRGALPWQEALEHVIRIGEALTAAHEQEPPILHGGLEPEDVMLTRPEGADDDAPPSGLEVMGFGVAAAREGQGAQRAGSIQYMSPEQIDARAIDARSDLYALGLIFYEMIAGAPPLSSASPRELVELQCTAPAPPLSEEVRRGLPRGVEELLFAMLEKKPEDRPSSAREVSERLAPFRAASGASRAAGADDAAPRDDSDGEAPRRERARTGAVAQVAGASGAREVPTWLAILAIVALSLAAGTTTYLVRLKAAIDAPPDATTRAPEMSGRSGH